LSDFPCFRLGTFTARSGGGAACGPQFGPSSQVGQAGAVDPIPIATSLVSGSAERFSSFHFIPGVAPAASPSQGEVYARSGGRSHPRDKMLSNNSPIAKPVRQDSDPATPIVGQDFPN